MAALAAFASVVFAIAAFAISQSAVEQGVDDQVEGILLVDKEAGTLAALSVLQALSTALLVFPLGYLYLATRYRHPEIPRITRGLVVAGPIVYGVLFVVRQLMINSIAADVVPQLPLPEQQAEDLIDGKITGGAFVVVSGLAFAGQIAVGAAFVLTSMHARRAGLLSNFMGILGIIVGALFVLPLLGPLPVVQFFWIGAVGLLILGRWPTGRGPAWETAESDAWPTAAEARAEAEADEPLDEDDEFEYGEDDGEPEEAEPEETEPAAPAHPRSKKRKRKRRR